jgi:hypothetical protein
MNNDDSPFASRRESPGIPASPIDLAIDRAVRKMMQVDPPAGLRRRVMSRIEAAPSTRRFMGSLRTGPQGRSFFVPGYAVAAATVAIVVLGVLVTRDKHVTPSPVETPAAVVAGKAPAGDAGVARAPQPDAATPPPSQRSVAARRPVFRREPIPMPRVADIFGTRTTAIAAAADPTADAVWTTPPAPDVDNDIAAPAPLVVSPVGVPPIALPPLVIAPIVVGRPPTVPPGPPR